MQLELRMRPMCVVEQAEIGDDDRVNALPGGEVHGARPARPARGLRVGVQRQQQLAAARVRVGEAGGEGRLVEVQAGEISRVGFIAQAEIDPVGAVIDCGFECRQAAGGTDEFHNRGCAPQALAPAIIAEPRSLGTAPQ